MLTLMLMLAMNVQDVAPVSPGACRVAAENFLEAAPRIRAAIEKDSRNSAEDRKAFLAMVDTDIASAKRVQAKYGKAAPDGAPLAGKSGSQQVDYMHRCDPEAPAGQQ